MNKTLAALAALAIALPLTASSAFAHATFEQSEVTQNATARLVIRVPHGCGDLPTLRVRVAIPDGIHSVQPMPKAGWETETERGPLGATYERYGREIKEGVREIVWTGELRSDFYDEFVFRAYITDDVPAGETLHIPVVQECPEDQAERWIEIPAAGQSAGDLRYPAPGVMVLPAADHGHSHGHDQSDDEDEGHSHAN